MLFTYAMLRSTNFAIVGSTFASRWVTNGKLETFIGMEREQISNNILKNRTMNEIQQQTKETKLTQRSSVCNQNHNIIIFFYFFLKPNHHLEIRLCHLLKEESYSLSLGLFSPLTLDSLSNNSL